MQYIEIDVKQHDTPISYQGKYHYRTGSTKQELKGNALNEFLLKKTGKTWGDVIESKATIDDIDLKAVEKFKKDASKSNRLPAIENENDLVTIFNNLQLTENNQIKRAAVLLFGKEPHRFFIGAFAKIGKFGKSDHDLQSQEVIEGNAYGLADQILEILEKT